MSISTAFLLIGWCLIIDFSHVFLIDLLIGDYMIKCLPYFFCLFVMATGISGKGDPIIKRKSVSISLPNLTLPHLCTCPKPGPGIPASYVVVFFMFCEYHFPNWVTMNNFHNVVTIY
jgi:hypothetical protein